MATEKRNPTLMPWQDPKAKPYIEIDGVVKTFDNVPALNNIWLSIYRGEFFSLLGPSGCGKTTLLRLLGGFETPTSGMIRIDGTDVANMPPYERPVNTVFQSYALFPHMTVEQNVAFGLKMEGVPRNEIIDRVFSVLNLVRMAKYARRKPHQISGGECQRVALARSLVKQPKLLLLDEPLAALDKVLRKETQFELVNIQEQVGITFIMVTHDQDEAMTMSTRIGIMEEGRIRQIGTPQEVYEYPNSSYVAGFVGLMNTFEGKVAEDEADYVLIKSDEIGCNLYISHASSAPLGSTVSVAIRPEKIMMTKESKQGSRNVTKGVVDEIEYQGGVSIYHVRLASGKIVQVTAPNLVRLAERPINWEDEVYLSWLPENGVVLTM